jgi:hypothetical protein
VRHELKEGEERHRCELDATGEGEGRGRHKVDTSEVKGGETVCGGQQNAGGVWGSSLMAFHMAVTPISSSSSDTSCSTLICLRAHWTLGDGDIACWCLRWVDRGAGETILLTRWPKATIISA